MGKHFEVHETGGKWIVKSVTPFSFQRIHVYADGRYWSTFQGNEGALEKDERSVRPHRLTLVGIDGHYRERIEHISIASSHQRSYQGKYRAGDILTACDNELPLLNGYLGHAAIVADERHIIEAVVTLPYIRAIPIEGFLHPHPMHALYRPKSKEMGEKAAQFAVNYYEQSERNRLSGHIRPVFSFSDKIPLNDPWSSVYCSKLVWLSYYYGAQYPFENDFYLFSPEDLDDVLHRDPNFECLYKHPEFHFLINT